MPLFGISNRFNVIMLNSLVCICIKEFENLM